MIIYPPIGHQPHIDLSILYVHAFSPSFCFYWHKEISANKVQHSLIKQRFSIIIVGTHPKCSAVPTLHYLESPIALLFLVASTTLAFDSNCFNSFNLGIANYKSACNKANKIRPNTYDKQKKGTNVYVSPPKTII